MTPFDSRILVLCATAATALIASPAALSADNETPFSVAELFFELNNTDGDLGIHAKIGGDPWKQLTIESPDDRTILNILTRGSMRRQGLSELAFESAEPPFDELPPAQFFARFPQGTYDIEGVTLDGTELESEVRISHVLPAPPDFVFPALSDCDAPVVVTAPVTIRWRPVTMSHPTIGITGQAVAVERYEISVERPDRNLKAFVELPPQVTSLRVPDLFTATPGIIKFEVLVKAKNGNRTAEESCFRVL
jgi:hypothetical protein